MLKLLTLVFGLAVVVYAATWQWRLIGWIILIAAALSLLVDRILKRYAR